MKKYILLLILCTSRLWTMNNTFILFDYTDAQTDLHNLYQSKNYDFGTISKDDPIKGFHLWAYNQVQQYCAVNIKSGCFEKIIDIGRVKQNQFLESLKKAHATIIKDIIHIINDDTFKTLKTLHNINVYLNAFEHVYLNKEERTAVFKQLINNLDINNLDTKAILNDDNHLISILLRNVANVPINDATFSEITTLLQSKKLDTFINFVLNTKIENINNTKDDERQNAIDTFINQVAQLDPDNNKDTFDTIITFLSDLGKSDWIGEIIQKQITMQDNKKIEEEVKREEEEKKREKENEDEELLKKLKKPGSRKGKGKRPPSKKYLNLPTDTTPTGEKKPTTDESKSKNDQKKAFDMFNEFDFTVSTTDALQNLINLTTLNIYTPEKINFLILLYNLYQEKKGIKDTIDYVNSDEKTILEAINKNYNTDLSAIIKEGLTRIENRSDDANLYLNAIIKDFTDKKLNLVSSDVKKTIESVSSIHNFPFIKNYLAKMQQKISPSQKNIIPVSSTTTSKSDALELFAESLSDVIKKIKNKI